MVRESAYRERGVMWAGMRIRAGARACVEGGESGERRLIRKRMSDAHARRGRNGDDVERAMMSTQRAIEKEKGREREGASGR